MKENLQIIFLKKILEQYSNKSIAVNELCNILDLGRDSVYRRLRGETILNPDEMMKLALAHKISIDQLMEIEQNDVMFTFNAFSQKINHTGNYMDNLINLLTQLGMTVRSEVWYASSEIPIFYQALVPEVFSFKLYVWARTVWNLDYFQGKPFDFEIIPADSRLKYPLLFNHYKMLPSVELWSSGIFDNTISQIEYHIETNMFAKPKDALVLVEGLKTICDHMRNMAKEGRKYSPGTSIENGTELQLYHNEMVYTNNTILFLSKNVNLLFSTICNPDFIMSKDDRMIRYMQGWFDSVIRKSILISKVNEKERSKFFDRVMKKLEIVQKKIELKLEVDY